MWHTILVNCMIYDLSDMSRDNYKSELKNAPEAILLINYHSIIAGSDCFNLLSYKRELDHVDVLCSLSVKSYEKGGGNNVSRVGLIFALDVTYFTFSVQ